MASLYGLVQDGPGWGETLPAGEKWGSGPPWVDPAIANAPSTTTRPSEDQTTAESGDATARPTQQDIPASSQQDISAAQRFLALMSGGKPVTFQTFDDSKQKRKALSRILHGHIEDHAAELSRLNDSGAGIFLMVNDGDELGRKNENVTGIRAIFLDLDGVPLEPVLAAGVTPHAVVESSPGRWHVYWLVHGCDLAWFKAIQDALAKKFDGDDSMGDLAQVLRVPGFMHRKNGPVQTRIVSLEQMPPYEIGDLVELLQLSFDEAPSKETVDQDTGEILDQALPRTASPYALPHSTSAREQLFADLDSALGAIDPDPHKTWVTIGMAMKTLDQDGYAPWVRWSAGSKKFDQKEADQAWESFKPTSTSYRAVFSAAQANGWVNPAKGRRPGYRALTAEEKAVADAEVALWMVQALARKTVAASGDGGQGKGGPEAGAATVGAAADAGSTFRRLDFAALAINPPPKQAFWWDDYLPSGVVTLFGAHGGTGKSYTSIMLAVSIAIGRPLFGVPTRAGRVAIFSGEDPESVVWPRLKKVCAEFGVSTADIADRVHVLDATDYDPTLYTDSGERGRRSGATTVGYDRLAAYVAANEIDVLIVDNASDAFAANEIERAQVRAFMRSLAKIAKRSSGAVMLLAHVDKNTAKARGAEAAEGYSGSTAWHNSARSRLFMTAGADGVLTLEHQKSNLGRKRATMRLVWPEGGLPALEGSGSAAAPGSAGDQSRRDAVLELIAEFTGRGEYISPKHTSPSNAFRMLHKDKSFPAGMRKPELLDIIRDAQRDGLLEREEYRTVERKLTERWRVVGSAPSAPTVRQPEDGADGAGGAPSAQTCAGGMGGSAHTGDGAGGGAGNANPNDGERP